MIIEHTNNAAVNPTKPGWMARLTAVTLVAITLVGTFFAGLIVLATGLLGAAVLLLALKWQSRQMTTQQKQTSDPEDYATTAH